MSNIAGNKVKRDRRNVLLLSQYPEKSIRSTKDIGNSNEVQLILSTFAYGGNLIQVKLLKIQDAGEKK